MRAPTLKRWVHYREVWGGPLLTIFFVDSDTIAAIITSRLGDVAQLGERCRRMAEAEGSIPFVSTRYIQGEPRHGEPLFSSAGQGGRCGPAP